MGNQAGGIQVAGIKKASKTFAELLEGYRPSVNGFECGSNDFDCTHPGKRSESATQSTQSDMKGMHMKTTLLAVTICVTIFITLFLGGASIAQSPPGVQVRVFPEVLPRVESTIQKTAVVALRIIAQARADIHRKAYTQAGHELDEAERLAHTMRHELSTTVGKELIGVALTHLEYEPSARVLLDLPPIYTALDTISVYIPTDKARRHLDRVKSCLEKGDKQGAEQELKLADRSLITIEVELPLLAVEKYIIRAQTYLAGNDASNADRSLSIAEQQTQAIFMTVASPLFQAKINLWLAYQNYSTSRVSEVRKQLDLAEINLEKVASSGNAWERQEARRLLREVAELGGRYRNNFKETGGEFLQAIWGRSKAQVERSAEYIATYWNKPEKTFNEDNYLIEAKLHVGYAETYQLTAREPSKASEELDKADSYLKKALQENPLNDNAPKINISGLEKDIKALKANTENSDNRIQDSYESIILRLSDLIQRIYLDNLEQKMRVDD
jgi:YfdX protein